MDHPLRIDFVTDVAPLDALDRLVAVATPILEGFGYSADDRGRDWAHWRADPSGKDLIRACAFKTSTDQGVSVIGEGEVPAALPTQLRDRVAEATGWRFSGA
jgi:hypothetical protein